MCCCLRNMFRWYFDLFLIFAPCDTDQARIVGIVRQPLAVVSEPVDQSAKLRCNRPLVRQTLEHRALAASGTGAAFWHVGRLVPVEHVARRIQIADLTEPLFKFHQPLFSRAAIARGLACSHPRACTLGFANLFHRPTA